MLLSIIIINYKTFDLTKECIDSAYKYFDKQNQKDFEVIVVDNASGDSEKKDLQTLRDKYGFKFIANHENVGFAAGCNLGAQMAEGEVLLFLNSDAKVEKGIIQMAETLTKEREIGIMGGKIVGEDRVVEKSVGKFYNLWNLLLMLIGGERIGLDRFTPTEFKKVDWVSGGFMLVKKEIFETLSGFDEGYFMYLEDMDLCLRASKKNWSTFYFPNASIIHKKHGSGSRQFAIFNIYRSMLFFYRKNKTKLEYNIARVLLYLKALSVLTIGKLMGRSVLVQTYEEVLKLF